MEVVRRAKTAQGRADEPAHSGFSGATRRKGGCKHRRDQPSINVPARRCGVSVFHAFPRDAMRRKVTDMRRDWRLTTRVNGERGNPEPPL